MSLMSSLADYVESYPPWAAIMDQRLHPVQYPQGEEGPWSVYRLDREERDYSMNRSQQGRRAETIWAKVEWRILAPVYDEAHAIAAILSDRLDGFKGEMGDIEVSTIQWIDSRDGEVVDEVINLYTVICDISVGYQRRPL